MSNEQRNLDKLDNSEVGCWFDSANGVYIGEYVQQLAIANGYKEKFVDKYHEDFCDAWDDAERYLNNEFAQQGYYLGSNENGDWGYWDTLDTDTLDRFYDEHDLESKSVSSIYEAMSMCDENVYNMYSTFEPEELAYIFEMRLNNESNDEVVKLGKFLLEESSLFQTIHTEQSK
jgi:hypothetical protein